MTISSIALANALAEASSSLSGAPEGMVKVAGSGVVVPGVVVPGVVDPGVVVSGVVVPEVVVPEVVVPEVAGGITVRKSPVITPCNRFQYSP